MIIYFKTAEIVELLQVLQLKFILTSLIDRNFACALLVSNPRSSPGKSETGPIGRSKERAKKEVD